MNKLILNFPCSLYQYKLGVPVVNALNWDVSKETAETDQEGEKQAILGIHNRQAEDIGHIVGFGVNPITNEVLLQVKWATGQTTSIHPKNVVLLY